MAGLRRRLGGRSLYWHGITVPLDDWAATAPPWPAEVLRDLFRTWQGGDSLYRLVSDRLTRWQSVDGESDRAGEAPASRTTDPEVALDLGGHRLRPAPHAIRRSPDGRRWRAYSPLDEWPGHLEVRTGCRALGVKLTGGVVSGVEVERDGRRHEIATGRVVVAAGTIGNSRLAIQALYARGLLDEPVLTGLVDKIAQGFVVAVEPGRLPEPLLHAAIAGQLLFAGVDPSARSNLFVNPRVNRAGLAVFDVYFLGEQTASRSGSVRCLADGPWPWPTIVDCRLGAEDQTVVAEQRQRLQALWDQLSDMIGVPGTALAFGDGFGSGDLPDLLGLVESAAVQTAPITYSFPLGSEQHEACTLPLGRVLDDRHQIRGIDGLHVAGPASFPRSGAANPALTVLALAARLAGKITEVAG